MSRMVVEWCATRMTILPSQHLKRITGNSYYYMASDFVVVLYPSLKIEFLEREWHDKTIRMFGVEKYLH